MLPRKNVGLAQYTTFHTGGSARYLVEAKTISQLRKAVNFAKEKRVRIFILGRGSNVLLPDKGINGLVIKISLGGINFKGSSIQARAGESWDKVVAESVRKKLGGIENLSLIPGTVGGAIYQNIGAYGVELKDVLKSVEVLDTKSGKTKILSNKECTFGYRDSIFQKPRGSNYIILRALLKLNKKITPKLNYIELKTYFRNKNKLSLNSIRNAVIKIRKAKLVYPTPDIGTVGSFFKNPVITEVAYNKLLKKNPNVIGRKAGDGTIKLFAGQLVEMAGWKGKRLGNVGTSTKHSMVLVRYTNGTTREILQLAGNIQKSVKKMFGIQLEPEVRIIK